MCEKTVEFKSLVDGSIPVAEAANRLGLYEQDLFDLFGEYPIGQPMRDRFPVILRSFLTGRVTWGEPDDPTRGVIEIYVDPRLDKAIVLALLRNVVKFFENQVNAPALTDDDDTF